MKQRMKELLKHLQENDYSTEDVVTIFEAVKEYGLGLVDLNRSITPEGTALARWRLDDARKKWREISNIYNLPLCEIDGLY